MAPAPWSGDSTTVAHVASITIFSLFALLAVIGRLWARKIQRHALDASDYLIVMGLLWALASSIKTLYSYIYWDLGGDLTQIGNPKAVQSLVIKQAKAQIVGIVVWAVAVFFIRASILVLYTRIFRTRSFRIICYMIHGFNTAFFATTVLSPCLICRPISFRWNHQIPGGTCGNQKALDLYIGIVNLLLDVIMVILPMPVLWGLQMATNKKVMLSFVFGLGAVICIITVIRVLISAENHGSNSYKVYSLVALFTDLEELLGVVNACLPVMKPLYSKFRELKARKWLSSVMSGSIPLIMRLSQMGSNWRSSSQGASSKANSTSKYPPSKEMRRWHGHNNRINGFDGGSGPTAKDTPPPAPRYVDDKPARMMFGRSQSATSTPSTRSRMPRPLLPSKGPLQSSTQRWEPTDEKDGVTPGIYVQKSWHHDVEKRASDEIDRHLLKDSPKRDYEDRW